MKYLLGIDFGGGASKATLLSEKGEICATATYEYPTSYPCPGYAEQNPADWVEATCTNIKSVLEKSGVSNKISKAFKNPISKLFNTSNEDAIYQLSLNISANMLGLSGIATPSGIKAMELLDNEKNEHAKTLLMVIASTSVQLLPLSVIQLVSSYGGNVLSTIIVTLISTIFSTAVGIFICKVVK